MDEITKALESIKLGNPFTHGNWTISKSGSLFVLRNSKFETTKKLKERNVQVILKNILCS
jgi:hypothetical protein